jgi:hypothetical protein
MAIGSFKELLNFLRASPRPTNSAEGLFNISRDLGHILCQAGRKEDGLPLLKQAIQVGNMMGHPDISEVEKLLQKYLG